MRARRRLFRACSRPSTSTAIGWAWSGRSTRVELAPIQASLQAGSIPVIASLGETVGGQILNINADFAANELVQVLQPYKIVFLTGTGGLLDGEGRVIDSINLSTEYDHLMAQPWINGGMRVKIEQIKQLLDRLPLSSSVSITQAGRARQGAVHAQGLGHAGAPGRARAAGRRLGIARPDAAARR